MTTLFDSARPVKAARRRFAAGVPSDRRLPYTASDASWWAAEGNRDARDFDVIGPADSSLELAAGAALAQARLDAGYSIL